MKAYTDYPIFQLGDVPGDLAPVRECEIIAYDQDKYCKIIVEGVLDEVKYCYMYKTAGRFREVEAFTIKELTLLTSLWGIDVDLS
jgi:hypothetical protein